MSITIETQRSGFYQELTNKKREEYLSLRRSKFLPMVDNLYFSVFILNDSKFITIGSPMSNLLNDLEIKKDEVLKSREPQRFSHGLLMTIKSYSCYRFCLTEPDLYDIFICNSLPNDSTPRIVVQLRALGLWTRKVEDIMVDAYKRAVALLDDYGLVIERCRESRIDYCYHTNAISSPNKIFKEMAGRVKYLRTNLEHATYTADLEHVKDGIVLHKDYVCFGRKSSNNVRARVYDKVKEVIEMGYKDFFFKIWYDNGLVSYYDKWCMEYAFPYKNMDYLAKARLAFYVEYGEDADQVRRYIDVLENKNTILADFRRLADEWMPRVTSVINIEYETKRKFYYYSDEFIDGFRYIPRHIPKPLERIYKVLDNRAIFLDYLTSKTLSFHKGQDEVGNIKYQAWWQRLRNTKLDGIKADEKLLRDYACDMNKKCVQRRAINALASSAVYEDKLDTGFIEDVSDFLSDVSDNIAHKMGRLLFVDEHGEVAEELYGSLLRDYQVIKAKKDVQLRNRKRQQE